jgi:ABC-type bacteriocin/lantibiotic exporter with double-glycine peptidase domain
MSKTVLNTNSDASWMNPSAFAGYLLSGSKKRALLKSQPVQETLSHLSQQSNLQLDQLLASLSYYMLLNELPLLTSQLSSLSRLSRLSFIVREDKILPAEYFGSYLDDSALESIPKLYFFSTKPPQTKLTKVKFVSLFMQNRWSIISLLLVIGTLPVIGTTVAELFQQPLFDNFVPEGRIPAIILVGIASIMLQFSAQLITSISSLIQAYFTQHIDLETKVATAQRFLSAAEEALPKRDAGSWRITFSVASAFLSSIESLYISIPLALISMVANLLIVGAFTDFSALFNLFLILLVPTFISIVISYFSSTIALQMMGQQSMIESTIYEVTKQIRGIWLTNTESIYVDRFTRSRTAMSDSLLRSGALEASSSVVNNLFQGLLYALIFYQYYTSFLDPQKTDLTVGSLLVIYFAIGSLSGSLSSIANDLVSIAQSLPTYWTPNAIRDIANFRTPPSAEVTPCPSEIRLCDLTYTPDHVNYPFDKPINLSLQSGQSYALVGPSGSGKTTLLSLMLGHLKTSSGSVSLFDENGQLLDSRLTDCKLLMLSQETNLYGSTLHDVVDPSRCYSMGAIESACAQLGLDEVLDSLSLRWKTPINEFSRDLSLGQLQRFKLSRALLEPFDIIFSDEATCHLPEELHLSSIALLNQHSTLHVSVLHRLSALRLFDQVITIDNVGNISVCPVEELAK